MSAMPQSRRFVVLSALWATLRRQQSGPSLGARLRALPAMTRDVLTRRWTGVGRGQLAATAAAVAYLVVPLDVVPELLLGPLGLLDDAVVVAWLAASLLDTTERYLAWVADPTRAATVTGAAGGTVTIPAVVEPAPTH